MKTGNSLRRWKFLTAGLTVMTLGMSGILPVSASSMHSVTDEAQIRPIKDGSEKYLMKSDGFYCLKDDGSKDDTAAVHYFDHVKIDGTVLDGFYYHDESGCFQAGSSHMVKLTKLSCSENPDNAEEPVEFDGYYMVNNLGKLTAAPQVRYISNYTVDKTTYDGYYYFDENGKMVTEPGTHELEMTSNGQKFSGLYYFGGTNGVLVQEAGMTEDGFPVDETGKVTGLENLGIEVVANMVGEILTVQEQAGFQLNIAKWDEETERLWNTPARTFDKPLYSASLIKAFVMAKTYQDMDDVLKNEAAQMKTTVDNTKVQDKVNTLLWNMITVSDNESCNELGRLQSDTYDFIDGAKQVNKYLKKEGYTKTSYQSTLHPSASKLITLGGHNQTTVTDCGKLLERIYRGECVSKEASEEMLDLLKNQQNTSKIPEGLGVDVPTANKTGETDEDQHDIAIVYGTKTTYILCVMSENASNAIANIRNISRVVYNYLNL